MKPRYALYLLIAGLVLLLAGFVYDVTFAGIPYQDPTPEMAARYNLHARIAGLVRLAGVLALVTSLAVRIFRRPSEPSDPVRPG